MSGPFHVVCHGCPREAIVEDLEEAQTRRRAHARNTGHDVEYAEVA